MRSANPEATAGRAPPPGRCASVRASTLRRHPLEFSRVMAEKAHPEKGKRPAKKARPGPGPRPKTRARGDAPRGRGTHELALQPLPHSKHRFKAAIGGGSSAGLLQASGARSAARQRCGGVVCGRSMSMASSNATSLRHVVDFSTKFEGIGPTNRIRRLPVVMRGKDSRRWRR